MLRAFTPVPPLRHGYRLHAADPDDPYFFRLDLTADDLGTWPVAFRDEGGGLGTTLHMGPAPMSLYRRPGYRNPARLAAAAAGAAGSGRGGAGRPPPFPPSHRFPLSRRCAGPPFPPGRRFRSSRRFG